LNDFATEEGHVVAMSQGSLIRLRRQIPTQLARGLTAFGLNEPGKQRPVQEPIAKWAKQDSNELSAPTRGHHSTTAL
jgi:hypothetical protein